MDTDIKNKKEEIRKETIRRLRGQDPEMRAKKSLTIQKKLVLSDYFRFSRTVMTYVSLPEEVGTEYLIQEALKQGKRVVVPNLDEDNCKIRTSELTTIKNLEKGPFGIQQIKKGFIKEIPLKEIDLIVIPAIAFSKKKMRLGRGKGCYDRFLASPGLSSVTTVGLAFRFQILDALPVDTHDKPVSQVITD